jgi:hypothetical protein
MIVSILLPSCKEDLVKQTNYKIDWEKLIPFSEKYQKKIRPLVTVYSRGVIAFNAGFMAEAKREIEDNSHLHLSYHPEAKLIVFEFAPDKNRPGALKMSKRGNIFIAGRSFFNRFKLDPNRVAGKYTPKQEHIPRRGKCWLIDLNERIDDGVQN